MGHTITRIDWKIMITLSLYKKVRECKQQSQEPSIINVDLVTVNVRKQLFFQFCWRKHLNCRNQTTLSHPEKCNNK